ncbi:MAG: DUF1015 family protein [Rhodothermales bacterium]
MATLHPFRAVRPLPGKAQEVACVPYDVINTPEARALAAGKPHSFLHVIRPEIDLPEGVDEHSEEVYERGAFNLKRFVEGAVTVREDEPSVYVYRLIMDGRPQTGIFGCVSVKEYDEDLILKHEKTRPVKEEDRTRHILTQRAHAEPVMLTYRDSNAVNEIVDAEVTSEPLFDFTADDGVRHTIWRVTRRDDLVAAFATVRPLYVADGHHRCKAASRAAEEVRRSGEPVPSEVDYFPAVLFPVSEMHILPYNRIVRELPVTPEAFLDALDLKFDLVVDSGKTVPDEPGTVCMYLDGSWHTLTLPETSGDGIANELDVARLSEHVMEPHLGITDPRRDPNLDFVGGIRGTSELERLVDRGDAELAFSMYPTSVEELLAVSDAGMLMPPKSTWFEPKLRSGLLVHLFD